MILDRQQFLSGRGSFFALFCFLYLLFCSISANAAVAKNSLQQSILYLEQIRQKISSQTSEIGAERQQAENALFLSFLEQRIRVSCRELYSSFGLESLRGLPCDPQDAEQPESIAPGVTNQEKLATLDQELATSLGAFDAFLLGEEERRAARQPRQRETAGTGFGQSGGNVRGSDADGGQSQGDSSKTGEGDQTSSGNAGTQTGTIASSAEGAKGSATAGKNDTVSSGDGTGKTGQKSEEQASVGGERNDRLEAKDDDIVARQLREAAEKETDPELKKKLWEEYYRYKGGRQ